MDIKNFLKLFDGNLCLSGGADGSDLEWGNCARKNNHKIIHWSFDGHVTDALEKEIVKLSEEELGIADFFLKRANNTLERRFPSSNQNTNNLLRRNYYQVAWTTAVYAVSTLDLDYKIDGGTAWAVELYKNRFIIDKEDLDLCKLYLFDIKRNIWWSWKGKWKILESPPPSPSGVWTGIGTRKLTSAGKWQIRKILGEKHIDEQYNIFPIIDTPKISDIVYIDDHKITGRGIDDYVGGWARIQNIQNTVDRTFISVAEISGKFFCWNELKPIQQELRNRFGMQHAQLKPDENVDNNKDVEYYRHR